MVDMANHLGLPPLGVAHTVGCGSFLQRVAGLCAGRRGASWMALGVLGLLLAICQPGWAASPQLQDVQPQDVGMSPERLNWAMGVIERAVGKDFPGAVIIVGRKGGIVAHRAFGQAQVQPDRRPMEPDTLFDLASVSKLFTATATMILVERGYLRLDDKVSTFIPDFGQAKKDAIRVRHLLTHTSGLPAWDALYRKVKTKQEMYSAIHKIAPASTPGTKYEYSDLGFIILGELIERVGGVPLDEFMRKEIWGPLGMTSTMYNPTGPWKEKAAATEKDNVYRKRLIVGEVHDENAAAMGGVAGHAGVFSTARDLAAFAQMFLNYGVYNGARILSPATVILMTAWQPGVPGERQGLGWYLKTWEYSSGGDLFSMSSYGHTGFTGTSLWIDPVNRLFSILLTNRVHPTRNNSGIIQVRPHYHNPVAAAIDEP